MRRWLRALLGGMGPVGTNPAGHEVKGVLRMPVFGEFKGNKRSMDKR